MNLGDFSNGFDTLVNAYNSRQEYGSADALAFDEYEKSVFLTRAQEQLVLSLYSGNNSQGESFEQTEEVRRYLSSLIREASLAPEEESTVIGISSMSKYFVLPEDLWFITYESVTVSSDDCHNGTSLDVIPVTQDEYHKLKRNPYRGASGRRALRLDLANNMVEVVCKYGITSYYIRYIVELPPIILEDLKQGLSIHGVSTQSECLLHDALHERILESAVNMGIASKRITNRQ